MGILFKTDSTDQGSDSAGYTAVSGDAIASRYSCSLWGAEQPAGWTPATDATGFGLGLIGTNPLSAATPVFHTSDPAGMLSTNGFDIDFKRAGRYLVTVSAFWTPTLLAPPDNLQLILRAESHNQIHAQSSFPCINNIRNYGCLSYIHFYDPSDPVPPRPDLPASDPLNASVDVGDDGVYPAGGFSYVHFRACTTATDLQSIFDVKINAHWLSDL